MAGVAAKALWDARVNKSKIEQYFAGAPETETAAYHIQEEMISASGEKVTGWKIGATNESLFDVLSVTQPFVGPLFDRFTYASGDCLEIQPGHALETELTVRLKSDLPPRVNVYSRSEIEEAVDSVFASFEIVGARFEGETRGAGCRLIADGGANVATILGEQIENWQETDFTDYAVTLLINDEVVNEGNTTVLLWDHVFDAVSWVAAHPAISPRGLLAKDLVMTGTCTGITPLNSGDKAEALFDGRVAVQASFTA